MISCIESLLNQETNYEYEVIVVDNNSTDNTKKIIKKYEQESSLITYCLEKELGISRSRNKGMQKATFDWIVYVDDDAKAHTDLIEIAGNTIQNENFDCFGGIYNAWYKYGKPSWIENNFGSNRDRMPKSTCILDTKCFSAGVCAFSRNLLKSVGGFPTDLGPKGNDMAYGEENYVQIKAREQGFTVGFVPEFQIDHVVRKEKLQKSWHYQDAYLKGVSKARLQKKSKIDYHILKYGILEVFKYPVRLLINGSPFQGNRNMIYYKGYFDKLFDRRRKK